jgi:hypothetical protein
MSDRRHGSRQEIDEELQFHIAERTALLREEGMSPDDAIQGGAERSRGAQKGAGGRRGAGFCSGSAGMTKNGNRAIRTSPPLTPALPCAPLPLRF